jgi:hypothetical protein
MFLQELATDLKQELAEKLMDLDVVKFSMYPVKVCLLSLVDFLTLVVVYYMSTTSVLNNFPRNCGTFSLMVHLIRYILIYTFEYVHLSRDNT